jgi:hypothetical protein
MRRRVRRTRSSQRPSQRLYRRAIARYGQRRGGRSRPSSPDGPEREDALIEPAVSPLELLRAHPRRPKDRVRRVVAAPIPVEVPPLGLEPGEQRGPRIRRQDVEGRALELRALDPLRGPPKHLGAVPVEAQDEAAVDLDPVPVEEGVRPGDIVALSDQGVEQLETRALVTRRAMLRAELECRLYPIELERLVGFAVQGPR